MAFRNQARWLLLLLLALLCACSKGKVETRGQLMLALTTDLQPPKDFDRIRVQVLSFGSTQFDNEYKVGKNALTLPATLGLLTGKDPSEPVTIRVIASLGQKVRMVREVLTTVPQHRVARLTVPIEWLCLDQVQTAEDGSAISSCGDGRTCLGGECVTNELDSSDLPDYSTESVFGGGDGSGSGSCFDTVGCFSSGYGADVDLEACTIALDASTESDQLSVALVRPPESEGICGPEACLIPLDGDVGTDGGGWSEKDGKLELPRAVCNRLEAGELLGVAVTAACQPKTSSLPTCGDWSSVSTEPGSFDADAPEMAATGGEAGSSGQTGEGGDAGSTPSPSGGSSGQAGEAGSSDSSEGGAAGVIVEAGGTTSSGGASSGGSSNGGEAGSVATGGAPLPGELPDLCDRAIENWHLDADYPAKAVKNQTHSGWGLGSVTTAEDAPGGALVLDGQSELAIADHPDLDLSTKDFAVSAWVQIAEGDLQHGRILSHGTHGGANSGYSLMQWCGSWGAVPCGGVAFLLGQDGVGEWLAGTCETMDDGAWHHYAVNLRRDSSIEFFVDGVEVTPCTGTQGSAAWSNDLAPQIANLSSVDIDTSCPFCIGAACQNNGVCTGSSGTEGEHQIVDPFRGEVDEVALFAAPLSADDVLLLYGNGSMPRLCGPAPGCVEPGSGQCAWITWSSLGASASWLSDPTATQAHVHLANSGSYGAGVNCLLSCDDLSLVDLSASSQIRFVADVSPADSWFRFTAEATNGTRGCNFALTSVEGPHEYTVDPTAPTECWTYDGTDFSWQAVAHFGIVTEWAQPYEIDVTVDAPVLE